MGHGGRPLKPTFYLRFENKQLGSIFPLNGSNHDEIGRQNYMPLDGV
jgi:hypothetical protein